LAQQQSSATVMFRALVMLACLVVIPVAAVVGTSLPEVVKRVLGRHWPARSSPESSPTAERGGEAPRFQPAEANDPTTPAVPPTAAPTQAVAGDWQPNYRQNNPQPPGHPQRVPDPAVVPAAHAAPLQVDPFTEIRDRLRQLGATRARLELWGSQGRLYRFCCEVSMAGSDDFTYYFEATDADHLRAMTQVLQQLEAWWARRRQPAPEATAR